MVDKTKNAGVDAQTGFALQRNTALYLILENYQNKFKNKNYFICLEHHDDFLYCFLNDNNEAEIIEAYQSKKKSPSAWELNTDFFEIIKKLLLTGKALLDDEIPKSKKYNHILFFSTNQSINLRISEKKKVTSSLSIKEDNPIVKFNALDVKIKDKITEGITDNNLTDELNKLNFIWIDLNRTVEKQENELEGQLSKVFGNSIYNKRAAIKALIELFREIEEKYNHGNKAKLLDESKRVTSKQIEESFQVLTSKSKCFDYWIKQTRNISIALQIKPSERPEFEFAFVTAFDLFKSITQAEHRKILNFVKLHISECLTYTDEENVSELIELFNKTETTHLGLIELKAIFFAALFETTYKGGK